MWEAKTDFAEVFLFPRAVSSEKALAYGVYMFFLCSNPVVSGELSGTQKVTLTLRICEKEGL